MDGGAMSDAKLYNLKQQLESLTYKEQLSIIEFLAKRMQNAREQETKDPSETQIKKINAVLDKISETEQTQFCDVGLEAVREALKNDTW